MNNSKVSINCQHISKVFQPYSLTNVWRRMVGLKDNLNESSRVLNDIDFNISEGEILGVLGRNGAGKSTLLRVLAHIYYPTTGSVNSNGQIVGLFEMGGFGNNNLTGREFATRYLQFMGVPEVRLNDALDDIKDFSELGDYFEQKIRTYSSGMAARLYFATATAEQYEIYLIDELLSVGDEHFQAKCWKRLRQRLMRGASGVLVTHDWSAVIKLCKRACVIKDGEISYIGRADGAVVHYLDLPLPATSDIAKFSLDESSVFEVVSGQDAIISIPVSLSEDASIDFAISIETLRIGYGWEIMILTEFKTIVQTSGKYYVDFHIPKFPLSPGQYSLNLFLTKTPTKLNAVRESLDVRSWTYGNGLSLLVTGEESESSVILPFLAERINEVL